MWWEEDETLLISGDWRHYVQYESHTHGLQSNPLDT